MREWCCGKEKMRWGRRRKQKKKENAHTLSLATNEPRSRRSVTAYAGSKWEDEEEVVVALISASWPLIHCTWIYPGIHRSIWTFDQHRYGSREPWQVLARCTLIVPSHVLRYIPLQMVQLQLWLSFGQFLHPRAQDTQNLIFFEVILYPFLSSCFYYFLCLSPITTCAKQWKGLRTPHLHSTLLDTHAVPFPLSPGQFFFMMLSGRGTCTPVYQMKKNKIQVAMTVTVYMPRWAIGPFSCSVRICQLSRRPYRELPSYEYDSLESELVGDGVD